MILNVIHQIVILRESEWHNNEQNKSATTCLFLKTLNQMYTVSLTKETFANSFQSGMTTGFYRSSIKMLTHLALHVNYISEGSVSLINCGIGPKSISDSFLVVNCIFL